MRVLIIATSSKPPDAEQEILAGKRYRIEYLELSKKLPADYVDYDCKEIHGGVARYLEERLRIDFHWAWKLVRTIRDMEYDVVLCMSERIGIPLAKLLPRDVKHFVIFHNPLSPLKLRLIKAMGVSRRWDLIVLFSHAETDVIRHNLNLPADRIKTLHFAIDTDFYSPFDELGLNKTDGFVFSLGVSNRDYPTLIRAMYEHTNIPCQISATSAWVHNDTNYIVNSLPENVQFVSYDHPSVIREAYANCRFVVIPIQPQATQWSAGASSVLQPQAMGKPVIATRMPGLSDYVQDGKTGILVEGGNPQAMAEAVEYFWENPVMVEEMGHEAIKWVRDNFSLDRWVRNMSGILTENNNPSTT